MMLYYGGLLLLLGLSFTCGEQVSVNRQLCKDAFAAENAETLKKCIGEWIDYPWVLVENDTSIDCQYCLKNAANAWDVPFTTFCQSQSDKKKCGSIVQTLSELRIKKDRTFILCNVLAVCNSHTYLKDLDFNVDVCEECKEIIDKSGKVNDGLSDKLFRSFDNLLCQRLPKHLVHYCEMNLRAHMPSILNLLQNQLSAQTVCDVARLCRTGDTDQSLADFNPSLQMKHSEEKKYSWINQPQLSNSVMWTSKNENKNIPSCDQCQAVFKQINDQLNTEKVQGMLKRMFVQSCSLLDQLQPLCEGFVDSHFNEFINEVMKYLPDQVCEFFGMCPHATSSDLVDNRRARIPILCPVCEIIFSKVFDLIAANKTEASIEAALDEVCGLLPEYNKACTDFIKDYGAKIVKAILDGVAPKLICSFLGVCDPLAMPESKIIAETVAVQPSSEFRIDACTTCKLLVETVYGYISENKTEKEIEELFHEMCTALPKSFKDKCISLIDQNLPNIIKFIELKYTAQNICSQLGFCSSQKISSLSEQNLCLRPEMWCRDMNRAKMCDTVHYCNSVGWKSPLISRNKGTKSPCEQLPLSTICLNFDFLTHCDRLHDCVAHTLDQINQAATSSSLQTESSSCSFCTNLLARWKLEFKLFGYSLTSADYCKKFEHEEFEKCNTVVSNNGKILPLLVNNAQSMEAICKEYVACDKSSPIVLVPSAMPLLGKNPCTWGPSYFCRSKKAAKMCKIDVNLHCKDKFWYAEEEEDDDDDHHQKENIEEKTKPNPCNIGLSYACSSIENAKSCNKLEECMKTVWHDSPF